MKRVRQLLTESTKLDKDKIVWHYNDFSWLTTPFTWFETFLGGISRPSGCVDTTSASFLEPMTYSRHVLHHHVSGFGNQHPRVAGVVLKEWRAQQVSEGPGTESDSLRHSIGLAGRHGRQNERFTNSPFCRGWTISVKPFTPRRSPYSLNLLCAAWCSCWRPFTIIN
jgi:hypothetical protein